MTSRRQQPASSSLPVRTLNHLRQARQTDERLSSRVPVDDTTFQIPYEVNASSNNLLLEDDDLDFLGGGDYTVTLAQTSDKDVLTLASTPRNGRKSHAQAPSNLYHSPHAHGQLEAIRPVDECEDGEGRATTPTPRGRSGAKRVSVTNSQAAPGAASQQRTYTNTSSTWTLNRDCDRHPPLLSPSLPAPYARLAPEAPPFEFKHGHMTIGDHRSEVGASCDHRALSNVLLASPQAPPPRTVSARSPSKSDGASPVSTATYAFPSDSSPRSALRAPSSSSVRRAFQDNQHGDEPTEAEQVDTITLKFKASRSSGTALMDGSRLRRPSTLSSRTNLLLDTDSGSGLSTLSETGVQDTEMQIESGSPDLPDIAAGAAHAGRDDLLREEVEDLRASRGAASIPKIGKTVPSAEARIEIQMKDKTAVQRAEKTKPASEQMKTKKAGRSATSSSSTVTAPTKPIVKPERKRKLEIDFKSGKSEKLGGQSAVKKTKLVCRNNPILPGPIVPTNSRIQIPNNSSTSISGIDKTTEMNAAPASASVVSGERPIEVHRPRPSIAHDHGVETTQHVHTAHETMRDYEPEEELEHVVCSEQPQMTVISPSADSELAKPRVQTAENDDCTSAEKSAPRNPGRTKLRDLDLRKMSKRPPRTSKVKPNARTGAHLPNNQKQARNPSPPLITELSPRETSSNATSSLERPPLAYDKQLIQERPFSRPAYESVQSMTEPTPQTNVQMSSDLRDVQGSDRGYLRPASTDFHYTGTGTSEKHILDMQATSVSSLNQDIISDIAFEHVAVSSELSKSKETPRSDLDEDVVDSTPLEPPSQTRRSMAQSGPGAINIAMASVPPHATSARPPTRMDVKLKAVHPVEEQKGKGKGRTNMSRQGPQRLQPPADDMFERKKRDTYLRKGIDLSAHSTTRFQKANTNAQARTNANIPKHPQADVTGSSTQKSSHSGSRPNAVMSSVEGRGTTTRCRREPISASRSTDTAVVATSEGREITGVPADAISDISRNEYYASSSSMPFPGREITGTEQHDIALHSIAQSPGHLIRTQGERIDPTNISSSSIGNVIADRLVSFGQKVIGTLGLLSSHSDINQMEKERESSHLATTKQRHRTEDQTEHNIRTSPLRLSELSPRKIRSWDARQGCETSDRNQWGADLDHKDESDPDGFEITQSRPMAISCEEDTKIFSKVGPADRPNRKRTARPDDRYTANGPIQEDELEERNRKRSKLSGADADGMTSSTSAKASKRKTFSQSSAATIQKNGRSGRPVNSRSNSTQKYDSATASSSQRQNSLALNSKPKSNPKYFCSLTVPITTTFPGDLLRQQRAIAKAEREGSNAGKGPQGMERLTKSADNYSSVGRARVPLSDKQRDTNLPPKPTIPQAFNFETETRLAQRRQDFEDKMKTWEGRVESNSGSSLNGHTHSHKPLPDFKTIHATHDKLFADMAARRREMVKPTVPIPPHFNIDQRLSEREKFEQARRAREEELERKLAEEQRLREEEEENAYQEARKRAVPRANAIPEWYAEAPKKPSGSRRERVP